MAHDHSFNAVAILREMQKARDTPRCGFCGAADKAGGALVVGTIGDPVPCICVPCIDRLAKRFSSYPHYVAGCGDAPE